MSVRCLRRVVLAATAPFLAATAQAAPPLEAYGRLPAASDVVLSPDGKRYALITASDTETRFEARESATGKLLGGARTEEAKARGLIWGDNDHLLMTVSATIGTSRSFRNKGEWAQVMSLNVNTGNIVRLLDNVPEVLNVVLGQPLRFQIDGKPAVIVEGVNGYNGRNGTLVLYRINLDNGRVQEVETGEPDTIQWVLGDGGKPVARADYSRETGEWRLLTRPGAAWKRTYREMAPLDTPYLMSLGQTDATVLAATRKSGGWQTHEVSIADGVWSDARPELSTDAIILDPATRRLIGTIDASLSTIDYHFFNEADQRLWRSLTKSWPGELVAIASWSDDRMTVVVAVDGPKTGNAYFLVDRASKTAKKIADRYPEIPPGDYAPVTAFHYSAADGTDIPAYLTLPRRAVTTNLPLIVLPHGGPGARDYPGFDWWAQALASRGYAVLQPQFRGSDGFGGRFRDAGFGEWGRKMQTDLSDGVRYLAKAGTIDPKRVCIVGGSYGGYAALAGVTLDPGVYRCASAVAGVFDLRQSLVSEVSDAGGESRNPAQRWWRRYMGAQNNDDPVLLAISPARHANAVKVPVQLIHGKDDTVVSYQQSVTMDKALKAAGADVEFITLEGEDHLLSRSVTRKQMLAAMVAFLEKHNPPAPMGTAQ